MNSPYSGSSYKADWALDPKENRTSITKNGVGMWWKASFVGGQTMVEYVEIKNRVDCCGERLAATKVTVGGQLCGNIENGTKTGKWYTVRCVKPLVGGEIQLTTTRNDYLQISGIHVFGWSSSSTTTTTSSGSGSGSAPNTKLNMK
jgi:hypothetical protein